MSDNEIKSLKGGDIILITRRTRSYLRTVVTGPGDETDPPRNRCVVVPIRKRSWTGRIYTLLDVHFLRHFASKTGIVAKKLMGGDELSLLIDSGFNVSKQILREIREKRDWKLRTGDMRIRKDRCRAITLKALREAKETKGLITQC